MNTYGTTHNENIKNWNENTRKDQMQNTQHKQTSKWTHMVTSHKNTRKLGMIRHERIAYEHETKHIKTHEKIEWKHTGCKNAWGKHIEKIKSWNHMENENTW